MLDLQKYIKKIYYQACVDIDHTTQFSCKPFDL